MEIPSGDALLKIINEKTLENMVPRWVRNIVANEEMIKKGEGIIRFFNRDEKFNEKGERIHDGEGKLKDIPAIVVSGGPSLNKNLKYLKEAKGKACIIAIDSTVKIVMEQGIKPDFVVMTDPEWGEWALPFEDLPMSTKGIPLLVDVYINQKALKHWEGDVYWYCVFPIESCALSKYVEPEFTGKPIGKLGCGGCVSSVAFAFAQGTLQCDPIIMIGEDHGYYDREYHHADGIDVPQPTVGEEVVDDIYGRQMLTTPVYKAYNFWFERIVCGSYTSGFPQVNGIFINATEGGWLLKGWLTMPFKVVIDKYLKKKYDIKSLIKKNSKKKIAKKKNSKRKLVQKPTVVNIKGEKKSTNISTKESS